MEDIWEKNQKTKFLIAGPCVVESPALCMEIAEEIKRVSEIYDFYPVFKASFDKANRTSKSGFRSIGMNKALDVLSLVKEEFQMPIITDVHETSQVKIVSEVVDFLQVPAFLCRQTDLIEACAMTGLPTLVKKGQFLSPESCKFIEEKFYGSWGTNLMIGERGTTFGYNDLIVDVTSIERIRRSCPNSKVIMDCTHSLQIPNTSVGITKGKSEMIEIMVRFAAASKSDGIFIETHPSPKNSPSDSENMLELSKLEEIIRKARNIYDCE
jgi:2-dehydro-3-deoxyphosphooctonate aldolase (KDO 8-P synthase)